MRMARGDREEREKIHKVSLLRALRVRRANLSVSLVLLDGLMRLPCLFHFASGRNARRRYAFIFSGAA
jgi:hypothetical protein